MIFDVLSRSLDINTNFLIEASAGTGKTYTIEHLFVRRLLEKTKGGNFLEPEEIAVLTFTRACAKELAERIRQALDRTIAELSSQDAACPDYIAKLYEESHETLALYRLRLIRARASLENAYIGTIHGFCHKVLREFEGKDADSVTLISRQTLSDVTDEFFRKEHCIDPLETIRLAKLIASYKNTFSDLKEHLLQTLFDAPVLLVNETEARCMLQKHALKYRYTPDDFEELARNFTGCMTRQKTIKHELEKAIYCLHAFCTSPGELQTQCDILDAPLFASAWFSKPKKNASHDNNDALLFLHEIEPYLQILAAPAHIEESYRLRLLQYVRAYMQKEGLFSYQELLHTMERHISNAGFCDFLQKKYKALIVDEFQDTDPVQWKILESLFLHRNEGTLHLVGDPKQAIYAFRNADVYSYMEAKNTLCHSPYVLCTNYRSSAKLIQALNTLFSGVHAENLFYLPKIQRSIQPPPIGIGGQVSELALNDNKAPITFFQVQGTLSGKRKWPTLEVEEKLFCFIAQEISFFQTKNIRQASVAILVKDRHQQTRLETYLQKAGIRTISRSKRMLIEKEACKFVQRLLYALMHPREKHALSALVCHPPFSYAQYQIDLLFEDNEEGYAFRAKYVEYFLHLKEVFDRHGIACFFQTLLDSVWPESEKTVLELLLQQPDGKAFMRDLEHLVECLITKYSGLQCSEKTFYDTLNDNALADALGDEALYCRYETLGDAVHIHTLHSAKGLEFDIVFSLGLVTDSGKPSSEDEKQELLRLFYVAATRAKKRLYIPLAYAEDAPQYENDSAITLFLKALEPEGLQSLIEKSDQTIGLLQVDATASTTFSQAANFCYLPKPYTQIDAPYEQYCISSYSSLYKHEVRTQEPDMPTTLPKGAIVGRLFHQVLQACICHLIQSGTFFDEKTCFELVKQQIRSTRLAPYVDMVFACIWNAFHATLLGKFSLSNISWKQAFVEAPFCMYQGNNSWIQGAVDLVFCHEEVFYLVDWKTNWLGDTADAYAQDAMQQTLTRYRYDMQAKLYGDAIKKHLGKEGIYGGFFFIFLRAFYESNAYNGILCIKP